MKKGDVEIGMLVAVNDLDDGQLYKVASFAQEYAHGFDLTYETPGGRVVNGGTMDACMLRKPTAAQRKNWKKETGRL